MKDLLNERIIKRYCYRIHITNEKQYLPPPPPPPFIGNNPPIWNTLHFYKKILIPLSMIFQKSQPRINTGDLDYVSGYRFS